jgi:hypothetical protein
MNIRAREWGDKMSNALSRKIMMVALALLMVNTLVLLPTLAEALPIYDHQDQLTIYDEITGTPSATVDIYWGQTDVGWQYEYHVVSQVDMLYQVGLTHDLEDPSIQPLELVLLPNTGDAVVQRAYTTGSAAWLMFFDPQYLATGQELQHFYIVYNDRLNAQTIAVYGSDGNNEVNFNGAVPEPGVLLLLGSGMIMLGALSRRKKL